MEDEFVVSPFVSGKALDAVLGKKAEGEFDTSRLRTESRKLLGVGLESCSLGRNGAIAVEASMVGPCVQTTRRFGSGFTKRLAEHYSTAGFLEISQTEEYGAALKALKAMIQLKAKLAKSGRERVRLLNRCSLELLQTDESYRSVARMVSKVQQEVALSLREVDLVRGRVERIEGEEDDATVLVVETAGDREVLKEYPLTMFEGFGLDHEGAEYLRTELSWTPDAEANVFLPALRLAAPNAVVPHEDLDASLTALPEPPKDWPQPRRRSR